MDHKPTALKALWVWPEIGCPVPVPSLLKFKANTPKGPTHLASVGLDMQLLATLKSALANRVFTSSAIAWVLGLKLEKVKGTRFGAVQLLIATPLAGSPTQPVEPRCSSVTGLPVSVLCSSTLVNLRPPRQFQDMPGFTSERSTAGVAGSVELRWLSENGTPSVMVTPTYCPAGTVPWISLFSAVAAVQLPTPVCDRVIRLTLSVPW